MTLLRFCATCGTPLSSSRPLSALERFCSLECEAVDHAAKSAARRAWDAEHSSEDEIRSRGPWL